MQAGTFTAYHSYCGKQHSPLLFGEFPTPQLVMRKYNAVVTFLSYMSVDLDPSACVPFIVLFNIGFVSLECRLAIFIAVELCWNVYPSTAASSVVLLLCHISLLGGLWCSPSEYPYEDRNKEIKKAD